jgi:energy-coupling factor transport system permease protein
MNPLAKFVAASIVGLALLLTLSPLAAGFVLVVDILVVAFTRLPLKRLGKLLSPLLAIAAVSALSTVLYGRPSGETYWSWGLICVSDGSIHLAWVIGLRIVAIGIPAVVLAASIDPTDLADSLTQLWRAPRRFVLGTLAAFRLVGLLGDDWRTLEMARRARGLGSGRGPVMAVSRTLSQAFALLVLSIRRASVLALAMEARGVNLPSRGRPASNARTAVWRTRDGMLVCASIAVAAVALVIAGVEAGGWGA